MAFARVAISSLSGGVGRQAPSKRLNTEAETIDNCLVTLEKSVEKRPPLSAIKTATDPVYLSVPNTLPRITFLNSGANTSFSTDNLYFHFLDIDGYNRYCIIINRAGYSIDPLSGNSFTWTSGGNTIEINLTDFVTVYRIEPTEWVKEVVDNDAGIPNTSGFSRGIFEYLTYGNKATTSSYRICNSLIQNVAPTKIRETFGSIDYDVGIILWNRLIPIDFLPDNSNSESDGCLPWEGGNGDEHNFENFYSNIQYNQVIHAGDLVNYKVASPVPDFGTITNPAIQEDVLSGSYYWKNVRDDIDFSVDPETQEEVEEGQSKEDFKAIPQFPASEVQADIIDLNGLNAVRMLHHYYDNPRLLPLNISNQIDWTRDNYQWSSPLSAEDRDTNLYGLGKVYGARSPYLTFPAGFYRATRYTKAPYFERVRSEGPNTVFDHRRMPIMIYKDTATDGKWRVKHMPLFPRRSGTSINNPGPTAFKRKEKIQAMAIWKNRLWVGTTNTVIASRTNSFFNWWIDDVNNLTDIDPIDIEASVGAYNKISHMVPYQKVMLVLSSGSSQFEIRGGSIDTNISAFNVEFRPTSFFSTSKLTMPQMMGTSVFFMDRGKSYIFLSGGSLGDEFSTSQDISYHCRNYLPEDIKTITASSATNTIFAVDETNPNYIYLHTFRTNQQTTMQNAFHRWILAPQDVVVGLKAYEKDFYIVSRRPANANAVIDQRLVAYFVSLETVPVTTPMIDWLIKLDYTYMSYSSVSNETTINLPFYDPTTDYVVKASEWGSSAFTPYKIESADRWVNALNYTSIKVAGDLRDYPVWVGRSYQMNVELSSIVFRQDSNNSASYMDGVLNLKRLTTRHNNSGNYDIVIQRKGRPQTKTTFYPLDLNSILTTNTQLKIDVVGEHLTKVLSYSEDCKIFIQSSYPVPCNITNIEILGNFRIRNSSAE